MIAIYGGIYIDLDFYIKKNLSTLLTGDSYFIFEPQEHKSSSNHLCNGFFAAIKYHPFILGWLEKMANNKYSDVMNKTGPLGLYDYYKNNKNKVLFGNTCDILSILDNKEISKQCKKIYNNYATTIWEESEWSDKKETVIKFIKIKNPIDNTDMLWEESDFVKNNYPNYDYDIQEKQKIFEYCKNNKYNYGVIDVGAHIGDLAITLALALSNIDRKDIIVYAIEPSSEKCSFIEKMSLINSVSNIKILNYGLSDSNKILGHEKRDNIEKNTGGQKWNIEKKNIFSNSTIEEESNLFISADELFKKGDIGDIGVYHIDVEGHEINVLKGSRNLINICKPVLFIEEWLKNGDKCKNENECKNLFNIITEIHPSYKNTGFLPNGDLIFDCL